MKISIVVPIYNAEKYISGCVDSLLGQTYKDIEIILIDDGSTDKSPEICDNYVKEHANIKVIHQQNGGVSAARNRGMETAVGEYVVFVDADDYVLPTYCENLIGFADEITDLIVSGFVFVEGTGKIKKTVKVTDLSNCTPESLKTNFDFYYHLALLNSPFAKLYKKDLIKDICFNTDVSMGEDFLFNLECYKKSKSIKFVPIAEYYYNISNENSATKKFKKEYFDCYLKCYIEGKFFKYGEVKFTDDALDKFFCANSLYFLQTADCCIKDKKEKRAVIIEILNNPYFKLVCKGKYNFSLALKVMQKLCVLKNYGMLIAFLRIKKALSKLKK